MKGIKVIDVGSNPEETQFGTCELCFSYGIADNPYMVLEFPDGTQVTVETHYWSWGNYFEATVDNVVDFSAWLSEQDLFDDFVEELKNGDEHLLIYLINEYKWKLDDDFAIMRDTAIHIVNQIDEPQKPVVPKFVVDWVDNSREYNFDFDEWFDYENQPPKVYYWLNQINKRQADLNTLALVTLIVNGANAVEVE